MSFDADTLYGEIKKVKKELDILRSQSRTDFSGSGGGNGGGFGVGGSTNVTPSVHATFALNPVVHRLDETDDGLNNDPITYNLELSITLRGASVIVEEGATHPSSTLEFHTINGTLNNGQILTIKPKEGKTLTLKTGGNIDITADVSVADTEFVILQYFDDNTLANSNPVTGTYSLLSGGGGDNLGDHTATVDLNMATFDILQPDRLFWETDVVIQAIDTTPTDGTLDRLEYNAGNLGGHDFFVDRTNTTIPRFGITETSIQSNVPLDMNLNHIIFQSITGVASPTGLEKRFLFSDSANSDNLSVKLPNGTIIDLELTGSTTLDSLTDTTITSALSSDVLKWDGFAWINEKIGNNSIMTNAMIEWAKINPAGSKLDDIGDCTIGTTPSANTVLKEYNGGWVDGNILNVNIDASANIDWTKINKTGSSINDTDDTSIINSANTVIKYDTGLNKWVAGSVQNDQVASNANIDWTKINKTGSALNDFDDTSIVNSANTVIKYDGGLNKWVAGSVQNDQVASNANIDQSKINLSITNSELAGGDYNAITGIGSQTQTLDMNDNMISNITLAGIVDTGGIARGSVSGDSTQGLVINGSLTTLLDVTTPIATFSKASNSGIDFHANVSMNTNYRITDVEDPVNNQDVVTKAWHNANAGVVAKLNDIGDCTIGTTPTSNTVLKEFNGGWVDGNVTYANIDSSTWADFTTHLMPNSDNDYDLGASGIQWRDIYIDGTAYLDSIAFGSQSMTLPTSNGINGQVLTTNGTSALSWTTPSSGDDLGNHNATTNLDMNGFNINDVDDISFSQSGTDIMSNTSGMTLTAGTGDAVYVQIPAGVIQFSVNETSIQAKNPLDMNSNKITDVTDPTLAQDVATKAYVDANAGGSGANTSLSNLSSVSINTDLTPDSSTNYRGLGSSTKFWGSIYGANIYVGQDTTRYIKKDGDNLRIETSNGDDVTITEAGNTFVRFDGGSNKTTFSRPVEFTTSVNIGNSNSDQCLMYSDLDFKTNYTDGQYYASSTIQGKIAIKVNGTTRYLRYFTS